MTEPVWRDVVGYEGFYRVSDRGNIESRWGKSTGLIGKSCILDRWRRLKQTPVGSGRRYVCVTLYRDGASRMFEVQRIVANAFHGPCPEGMECCHNDGNPANNAAANLRWDTHQANIADCILHGTTNRGERNGHSKLTAEQVLEIRSIPPLVRARHAELAAAYGVQRRQIGRVLDGTRWMWLQATPSEAAQHTPSVG